MSYVDTLGYMGASCFQSGANMKLVDEDLVEDNPYIPPATSNIFANAKATVQNAYIAQTVQDTMILLPDEMKGEEEEDPGARMGSECDKFKQMCQYDRDPN